MKRILVSAVAIFMLFLSISSAVAEEWKIKINEITKPGLTGVRVSFSLLLDGANYVYDEIIIQPSELNSITLIQKKQYLSNKVKDVCKKYIDTYNISNGLEGLIGQEFNAQ